MTRSDDMRVGDAERDAVALALHDHFAVGRIDREELDERLDTALAAKTDGDLRTVVRDLPGHNGLTVPAAPASGTAGAAWDLPFGPPPWFHGHPRGHGLGHARGHGHPHLRGRQHPAMRHGHHAPFAKFPLLVGLFVFVVIAAGPGAAVLAVLQVAMLIWIVRAVLLAVSVRRARKAP